MDDIDPYSGRRTSSDARPLLATFREQGARSFHLLSVHDARAYYEQSCAANGLRGDDVARVEDHRVNERFTVRVYTPATSRASGPAILFLHGGGWVIGSLDTHDSLCRRLATGAGVPVVAVDYRLAPEHPYPAAIEDARDALRWLLNPSAAHGLHVESVVLAGDSAGAQLATSLVNAAVTSGSEAPLAAQVLLYPVTDLTMSRASYRRIEHGFPLVAETMRWFADHYLPRGVDRHAADLSPLLHDIPVGIPPTFIVTVDHDPLADEGIDYAAALARSGTDVHHLHLAGYAHGLFTSAGVIARGEQVMDDIATFLRSILHSRSEQAL